MQTNAKLGISINEMDNETAKASVPASSAPHWFALKVFYNKVLETEDRLRQKGIESYFPCEEVLVVRNGVRKKIHRPMVSSLLFFRSTVLQALEIQSILAGKVILYTRQKGMKKPPIAIPDREMNVFMLVTSSGERGLEFLGDDHPKYHCGDRVRVTDGPFKGAEGHICRIRKNNCLVVSIEGICAIATSYIPRCFLEKIS